MNNRQFFVSLPVSKAKVFSAAAIIVLIVGSIWLFFHLKEEDADVSKYINNDENVKNDKFNRHTVVSNGPECAPIGM